MMKPVAFLSAILAAVYSSDVVVKFSTSNLVTGSEEGVSQASVMSLARLTMESLAIPQTVLGAQPLPIVPDLISHTNAFGILFLENYNAQWNVDQGGYAFQKEFTLEEASTGQFPALVNVLAEGAKQKNAESKVLCSGKLCSKLNKESVGESVEGSTDKKFLNKLNSFDLSIPAENEFVSEIAQLHALINSISNPSRGHHAKDLYVATISTQHNLTPEKQEIAAALINSLASEFQETLKNAYTKVGVQLIKVNGAMTVDMKALSATTAFSRSLNEAGAVTLTANDTLPTPLTIEEISEYQVILWSSVILVLIIFVAISMLSSIDASRDNLLYAKFLTDPSGRKND